MAPKGHIYNECIATRVKLAARKGVSLTETLALIQDLQDAPKSYAAFKKHYGDDYDRVKAEVNEDMNDLALKGLKENLKDYNMDAVKFQLERKGGFNKVDVHAVAEVPVTEEETMGIKEKFADMLKRPGMFVPDEEDEPDEGTS